MTSLSKASLAQFPEEQQDVGVIAGAETRARDRICERCGTRPATVGRYCGGCSELVAIARMDAEWDSGGWDEF